MLRFARTLLIVSLNTNVLLCGAIAQEPKALPLPDERYKADLLLVVRLRIWRGRSMSINASP